MSDSLGVDDQMVSLSLLTALNDMIDDLLLVVVIFLGDKHILRTVGDSAPERNIPGVAPHNLNDTASLMGGRGILHLVNGPHGRVDCRVKTDGILCTRDIQVDGSRDSHGVDPQPGKRLRPPVGAVSADHHNTVNAVLSADVSAPLLVLRLLELQTSGRTQHRASALNNIGHITGLHIYDLFIQQSVISLFDAFYLQIPGNGGTNHGPDGRIHPGCVSAAGQHCNCLYFI